MQSQQTFITAITANVCDRNHSNAVNGGVALYVSVVGETREQVSFLAA
jgi:hypothetical protein